MPALPSTAHPRCDECGTLLHRSSQPRTWTYKGRTVTVDQPGWYCGVEPDHEPVYDEPDIKATEPVFLALRAEVEDTLPPAEVLRIRRRLGMSQREAGRVLGGGPMAFHKYEKGEIGMTRAAAVLLRLLDRHPDLLAEIVGQRAA